MFTKPGNFLWYIKVFGFDRHKAVWIDPFLGLPPFLRKIHYLQINQGLNSGACVCVNDLRFNSNLLFSDQNDNLDSVLNTHTN